MWQLLIKFTELGNNYVSIELKVHLTLRSISIEL